MKNNVSKQVLLSVIGVAVLVIAVIGVSFALYVEINYDTSSVGGYEKVVYENDTKEMKITNSLPVSQEQGKNSSNVVSFKITGKSKRYDIKVISGDKENQTRLKDSEVFAYVYSEDVAGITFKPNGNFGTTGQALGSNEVTIGSGYFAPNNNDYRSFDVHFWVDDSVVSVGNNGTYTDDEYQNTYYSARVIVEVAK